MACSTVYDGPDGDDFNIDGVPNNVDRRLRIEGRNSDVSKTGEWVDIWEGPTDIIPEPNPLGETLVIVSSNVNDTLAGTGTQIVQVLYLNTAEQLLAVDVEMNGTTQVVTAVTDMTDVIDILTIQVGSNSVSVGAIDVIENGVGTVYARIAAGGNKSQSTLRHLLPLSAFYLTGMTVSSSSKGLDVVLRATSDDGGNVIEDVYIYQVPLIVTDAPVYIPFRPAIYIPGRAKVKMSARTVANGTHAVATMINGWVKI